MPTPHPSSPASPAAGGAPSLTPSSPASLHSFVARESSRRTVHVLRVARSRSIARLARARRAANREPRRALDAFGAATYASAVHPDAPTCARCRTVKPWLAARPAEPPRPSPRNRNTSAGAWRGGWRAGDHKNHAGEGPRRPERESGKFALGNCGPRCARPRAVRTAARRNVFGCGAGCSARAAG